jgi:hypothetical protein
MREAWGLLLQLAVANANCIPLTFVQLLVHMWRWFLHLVWVMFQARELI